MEELKEKIIDILFKYQVDSPTRMLAEIMKVVEEYYQKKVENDE